MTIGIDDGSFYLKDNFPGVAVDGQMPSKDALTTYTATALFPVGTKRKVYDSTNLGWATLIYLRFQKGGAAVATVKSICGLFKTGAWYDVTNDASDAMLQGPICVALGTCTNAYYGWFWCEGVCPVDWISGLDGIFPTDGSVVAEKGMKLVTLGTGTTNRFKVQTASEIGLVSAFSIAADTTS